MSCKQYRYFFFYCYGDHRDLHSFPTRRSSDLGCSVSRCASTGDGRRANVHREDGSGARDGRSPRSEEHTSELQSRRDLVCRLLLEKKKKAYKTIALYLSRKIKAHLSVEYCIYF